jgi:hypothetical protein
VVAKCRQEQTRADKSRQEQTRADKSRQEEDKSRQEQTKADKRADKRADKKADKSRQEQTKADKSSLEQARADKSGGDGCAGPDHQQGRRRLKVCFKRSTSATESNLPYASSNQTLRKIRKIGI